LAAKPIIDILVFVHDIDRVEQHNNIMQSHGYQPKEYSDGKNDCVMEILAQAREYFNK